MKLLSKLNTKANNAVIEKENSASNTVKTYYAALAALGAIAAASSPLFAFSTIFNKVRTSISTVYKSILTITTLIAGLVIVICMVIRMVSKNQRSVEEATSWVKRVIVSWIIINALGWIIKYGQELTSGGGYTGWS